jgi:hypothetical protein
MDIRLHMDADDDAGDDVMLIQSITVGTQHLMFRVGGLEVNWFG